MSEMTPEKAAQLRKPFPKNVIGVLPKPYKKDSVKSKCGECGGFHGMPAVHLDFVGHAATTDRLLQVDPGWSWEPMALDQFGSPFCDKEGNLWIRLTVAGRTMIGVGDGGSMKERIGDAIRNAAMRMGVALDLWSKDELEQTSGEGAEKLRATLASVPTPPAAPLADDAAGHPESLLLNTSGGLAKRMFALFGEAGITDRGLRLAFVSETVGRTVAKSADMTDDDARAVSTRLEGMLDAPFTAADEPSAGGEA